MKRLALRSVFGGLLASVLVIVVGGAARAGDWTHWRGPQRSDVVAEHSGYRGGNWPIGEAVWSAEVGQGASSPLVVGGRVFAQGWRDGREALVCLDAATGRELWKQSYKCPRYGRRATGDEGLYSGPSSTPEYDPATKRLFTLSVDGDLNCWEAERGRHLWGLNLYDEYDVPRRPRHGRSGLRDYGYTTSPLVHGGSVIVEVGDDEGALMAFDVQDGKRLWASECREPAGHTGGPAPITVEGVPCVAAMTYEGLLVARLDAGHEGRTVARYPWSTDFANNIASPAVEGNSVLITSSYNRHAICRLDVTLRGANKVWEQPLASKVCSPVIYDGHVYWAWQQVHCLDFATGAERFSGGSFGDAGSCIVTGDAKLIVWGGRGKLALVETAAAAPREYRELAVHDLGLSADAWPHVVLADRRLFCKDRQGRVQCFAIGDSPASGRGAEEPAPPTKLGVEGRQFTVNGRPTFLLGISYYGALGTDEEAWRRDLDQMRQCGFNWLRVWATWASFGADVSAVEPLTGEPRQPFLQSLRRLVAECDRRGMIVDVSLSRGDVAAGPPRLIAHEAHRRAVQTIVEALKEHRNWYLDLSNERNIQDQRHTSFDELRELRGLVRRLAPERLVTASHGGDIGREELRAYVNQVRVDFISPHRPRGPSSPGQTAAKTREYLAALGELDRVVPVHYQEPFRRGYSGDWQPSADDFLTDLAQARAGGAAGWCFHNGDQRGAKDSRPRRSFDLRDGRLFEQLDAEERKFVARLAEPAP